MPDAESQTPIVHICTYINIFSEFIHACLQIYIIPKSVYSEFLEIHFLELLYLHNACNSRNM